jgi:hypothetical protein
MSLIDAIRAVMGPAAAAPRTRAEMPEEKATYPKDEKARKAADPVEDEAEDEEMAEDEIEAEDDEEEVEAMDEDEKSVPAARKAERARIAAILTHPAAAANPSLAAHYAFRTGASLATAGRALKAASGSTAQPSRAEQARKRIAAGATRLGPDAPRSATSDLPSIVAAAQARKGKGILTG